MKNTQLSLSQTQRTDILQHLLVLAGFLVLALVYCLPVLDGNLLMQPDIMQWKGMARGIELERAQGTEPLWTNRLFGGMTAFNISVYYDYHLPGYIHRGLMNLLTPPVALLLIVQTGMFILLRGAGVNLWLSAIGAIAFGFSSNYLISLEAGHNTKVATMGYSTALLGSILYAYRGQVKKGALLAMIFTGLMFVPNHVQIIYYALIMSLLIGLAYLVKSIREKTVLPFLKATGLLAAMVSIGLLANIAPIWSIYEHGKETMRGGASELSFKENTGGLDIEYATNWSLGIDESATTLVPYFMGGGSTEHLSNESNLATALNGFQIPASQREQILSNAPLYFGEMPFTSGPVYFGAGIIFLFVLGLLTIRMPLLWAIIAGVVLSFFMAWGKYFPLFNEFLFYNLPMYNKFRTPSMALHIAGVLIPLLGLVGLQYWLGEGQPANRRKKLTQALLIMAGLLGVIGVAGLLGDFARSIDQTRLAGSFWLDQQAIYDAIVADRKANYLQDVLRSFLVVAGAGGLLWLWMMGKLKNKTILLAGLAIILLADVWMVSKRYMNNDKFVTEREYYQSFQPTQADLQILADTDPYYRVFNLTRNPFNDATTSYLHNSVGGYHAAKLQRYQDMIDYHISRQHMGVLNMLNTKYFIVPGQNQQPVAQRNPGAMGNAWFVDSYRIAPDGDAEITYLDQVFVISDAAGESSILTAGNASAIDTVGSFQEVTLLARQGSGQYPLDLRSLQLQPGITYTIGAADSCSIQINEPGFDAVQATISLLYSFNPATEAIVHRRFADKLPAQIAAPQAGDLISLSSYTNHALTFRSTASGERLAVFSDIYYPNGWEVTIDGQPSEYFRVNYILRGMVIPAGEHTIEWTFRPKSYYAGVKVGLIGSLMYVLIAGWMIFSLYKGKREHEPLKM